MEITSHDSLEAICAEEWDALAGTNPFLKYGFLRSLETSDCLQSQGWYPQHIVVSSDGSIVGAMPLYVRDNSYGEFVFDWAWAEAYEKAGGRYYPKLVSAIPFSPVSGSRLLTHNDDPDKNNIKKLLVSTGIKLCTDNNLSSWHCLFIDLEPHEIFVNSNMLARLGCQYHWFNRGYLNFQDFLSTLSSKKRKNIKRERRLVDKLNLNIETLVGAEISEKHWQIFYTFYCATFTKKWGAPRLTLEFFLNLEKNLPGAAVLILANDNQNYVAGAFSLQSDDVLYGRHWGCARDYNNLHFELCYYQTIEYCIKNNFKKLDAGAQGEHKIGRGFEPVETWSMHWLKDENFRAPVANFLDHETKAIKDYIAQLSEHSAFRKQE